MTPVDVVIRFVTAINAHDSADIAALVTEDHRFVDSLGTVVRGRAKIGEGWQAYWRMVPDYEIDVRETFHSGDVVVILGTARGTYTPDGRLRAEDRWEAPAAWRAVVRGDQVAEWQVYVDNEPIRRRMAGHSTQQASQRPMEKTMTNRTLVPSTSPFAEKFGFSRAVRVGNFVSVGGTAPIGADGKTVGIGNAAEQMEQCLRTIQVALLEAGASLGNVVRTRVMLTNIEDWEKVAVVRGQHFKDILPVDTVVEGSRFINPEWLVEVEVDAIIHEGDA